MEFLQTLNERVQASELLPWIILLPLLGAVINGVFGKGANKSLITTVSVGSVFLSFLLALFCFGKLLGAEGPEEHVDTVYEWFRLSAPGGFGGTFEMPVRVRFVMDHLSGIMTVMITGIASLIHLYSTGYMGEDPGYRRFMTYLNLFTASMLILVLASNIPLMFVGWEGVGLCSYLLIGFWWENPTYAAAGRKAFVVNRIGDFGVLIGTFLIVSTVHSFEFSEINAASAELAATPLMVGGGPVGIGIATGAALFLFLGCTGKSAQLPLYVWLPDAMAGPTPVSALIHAATMVTSGIYLCCRLSPVFIHSEGAMITIALVGAATAFIAASIGLVQNQIKKILAYSTVSQLGFMFAAVGVGAFSAGFFHVFTHAFFKACLFLGAGSVMHAVHAHGDADIRYLGNMRKYMPRTHATFLISCLAIAGFPLTSGFFSKDEILLGALDSTHHLPAWVGWTVFSVLAVSAFMTAFYMFRLYFRTFWGEFKGGHPPAEEGAHDAHGDDHAHAEPHESEDAITLPLIVLAVGALLVGFLGLPHWVPGLGEWSWWGHWLNGHGEHIGPVASWAHLYPVAEGAEHGLGFGPIAMAVGTLVGLGGIGLAYAWYYASDGTTPAGIRAQFPAVHSFLMDKWRVDELYEFVFIGPFKWIAVVAANIDRIAVDGLLTKVPGLIARGLGALVSRMQSGAIYAYTTGFAIGAFVLVWWFTYPHVELEVTAPDSGTTFEMSASTGPGYEYRWDFDSDGEPDTEWSGEHATSHTYENDAFFGLVLVIEAPDMGDSMELPMGEDLIVDLEEDETLGLPVDRLAIDWIDQSRIPEAGVAVAPTARLEISEEHGAEVVIVRGSAALVVSGTPSDAQGEEVRLRTGDTARIGLSTIRVAARARVTLEVKNLFGNHTRVREDVVVALPTPLEHVAVASPTVVGNSGGAR
ncbi:MAG: NADH-quinone oxidoreductase subunit L [Deltaproteobacteria bacterium]|nr:NADH-quinone oxidoreductase subunit L [Deltaproteobacteria bacterium]